jgi:hypothetical protein
MGFRNPKLTTIPSPSKFKPFLMSPRQKQALGTHIQIFKLKKEINQNLSNKSLKILKEKLNTEIKNQN